jgi:cell division protein FtsL
MVLIILSIIVGICAVATLMILQRVKNRHTISVNGRDLRRRRRRAWEENMVHEERPKGSESELEAVAPTPLVEMPEKTYMLAGEELRPTRNVMWVAGRY